MNQPTQWDVVIIGGGPGGSMSGYHLAKAGLKVAIVEMGRFPRAKACGGGIQVRACRNIPFAWNSVVKSTLTSAQFSFRFGDRVRKASSDPIVHCVLRPDFDNYLLRTAEEAGAKVFEGVRTQSVTPDDAGVTVTTNSGTMRARYVIGADGANSIVSKVLNQRANFFWQVAIYMELASSSSLEKQVQADALRIDLGSLPAGYAWIFPKDDKINIGAGCPTILGKYLRQYFHHFLKNDGLLGNLDLSGMNAAGHQLPTLTPKTVLAGKNLFLVGDAAGLVEPLTGEGISYACHSAEVVAHSILTYFDQSEAAKDYRNTILRDIGYELVWARRLLSMSISFPRIFYWLIQHQESLWRVFCDVLRGNRTFQELYKETLGPLTILDGPIDALFRQIEKKRLIPSQFSELFATKAT
jgi:geranylgeranyl reductase family protein